MNLLTFTECLLCTRHCSKCFTLINSFNYHVDYVRAILLSPCSNLPKITQILGDKANIQIQIVWLPKAELLTTTL